MRPFSLNGQGLAINVFNIRRGQTVRNAPIKGQCARDYFYGKGAKTEDVLSELEGHYARITRQLIQGHNLISDDDKEWLYLFLVIQQRRTASAIKQFRDATDTMADAIYRRAPEQRPKDTRTDTDIVYESMRIGLHAVDYAKDLKMIVFENKTSLDFILCDNPSLMTNRYHFQKLNENKFGMINSGAIHFMPLSPRLSLCCYDAGVYTIPNDSGTSIVSLRNASDVHAINQLQILNAHENIYFQDWGSAAQISAHVSELAEKRASMKPETTILVRDKTVDGEAYRRGTDQEELVAQETLAMTSFAQAPPDAWPAVIKLRSKPRVFSNGTAIGYVRKREWLTSRP